MAGLPLYPKLGTDGTYYVCPFCDGPLLEDYHRYIYVNGKRVLLMHTLFHCKTCIAYYQDKSEGYPRGLWFTSPTD